MTEPQKMPELLTDLASRAQKILAEKTGMETSLAEHVGFEIAREMAENWGGQSIYVPKVTRCNCTTAMNRCGMTSTATTITNWLLNTK